MTSPKLHYNSDQVPINLPAIVGCLKWIALRTRPDIAWATRVLGDASFAPTGEKSQQGIVVYHGITSNQKQGGNLVQCRSSRQDLIAKSTCEAELIASSEALQQGENISIVVSEIINASCDIEVSSDNAAALHMVRNGSETAWRTRHISVKTLWLHQMLRRGSKFTYQPTSEMAADSLMKGLGASRLPQIRKTFVLLMTRVSLPGSMWFPTTSLLCLVSAMVSMYIVFLSCDTLCSIEIVHILFHVYSNSCGV